tara:strand:+ start:246 stop:449 length:204 start_codon:yes stop_codon:yes gene_type:complete
MICLYLRENLGVDFIINLGGKKMPEEFEHDLIGVLQEHYGKNFDYNWDSEEGGFYIRLRVWEEPEYG